MRNKEPEKRKLWNSNVTEYQHVKGTEKCSYGAASNQHFTFGPSGPMAVSTELKLVTFRRGNKGSFSRSHSAKWQRYRYVSQQGHHYLEILAFRTQLSEPSQVEQDLSHSFLYKIIRIITATVCLRWTETAGGSQGKETSSTANLNFDGRRVRFLPHLKYMKSHLTPWKNYIRKAKILNV